MRVAIQGERGSFSHQAASRFLPHITELLCCPLSAQVFERLSGGSADAAVIPIENTLAGSVLEHYDLLLANPVHIQAELLVRIRHNLIAAPGVTLPSVRAVYSHPIALAQCRNFFAAHPHLQALPFYDTAGSVAHAVRAQNAVAGIASEAAAGEYGGEVLLAGIEDHARNYTRFLLLRREAEVGLADTPGNKVSLAFAVPNQPGALAGALGIFAQRGLNLTRLESRPVPGSPWEYVFYADYQIAAEELSRPALAELEARCSFVKELGRYWAALPTTQPLAPAND